MLAAWHTHWLTGWGLLPLPFAFQERLNLGASPFGVVDLHNTWLDVLVRGGCVGFLLWMLWIVWTFKRSKTLGTLWTWGFWMWVMCWQSIAAQPALLCLLIVWWLSLHQPWRNDARPV